jgi:hypothetical protein
MRLPIVRVLIQYQPLRRHGPRAAFFACPAVLIERATGEPHSATAQHERQPPIDPSLQLLFGAVQYIPFHIVL